MKTAQSVSNNTLHKLADSYRQKGYKVFFRPSITELPEFLSSFRPDLLALSKEDNVVVEVKRKPQVIGSAEVVELAKLIESRQGWRYELIIDRPSSDEKVQMIRSKRSLANVEIAERLSTASQLLNDGLKDSALLLAWTGAEAVFWRLALAADLPLDSLKSSYLIKSLYSHGLISWKQYEQIRTMFAMRSEVAHGFTVKGLSKKTIIRFIKLTRELLDELKNETDIMHKDFGDPIRSMKARNDKHLKPKKISKKKTHPGKKIDTRRKKPTLIRQ